MTLFEFHDNDLLIFYNFSIFTYIQHLIWLAKNEFVLIFTIRSAATDTSIEQSCWYATAVIHRKNRVFFFLISSLALISIHPIVSCSQLFLSVVSSVMWSGNLQTHSYRWLWLGVGVKTTLMILWKLKKILRLSSGEEGFPQKQLEGSPVKGLPVDVGGCRTILGYKWMPHNPRI